MKHEIICSWHTYHSFSIYSHRIMIDEARVFNKIMVHRREPKSLSQRRIVVRYHKVYLISYLYVFLKFIKLRGS